MARQARTSTSKRAGGGRVSSSSVPLSIRLKPKTYVFATELATQEGLKRSKLDEAIYHNGTVITAIQRGPGEDGTYAGRSRQELAREARTFFLQLYELLDEEHEMPELVYRVMPPNGNMPPMMFMPQQVPTAESTVQHTHQNDEYNLQLNTGNQQTLSDFSDSL